MAGNTSVGFVGDQDLVYGFDPKNVAASLTTKNWRRKAILRQYRYGLLYVWVWEKICRKDGKEWVEYAVKVKRLEGEGGRHFERTFDNVEDALRYVKGEDGSVLSRYTHPVSRMILKELGAQPAPTILSVMGIGHQVDIPGPEVLEKKHRKEEKITLEPESYCGFLTKVLRSVLKIAPDMSKHVYTYGLTLHPDVKTRVRLGQNLPDQTTVRIYKGWDKLAARFHVFPNEPRARGLIRAVRIDDSVRKPGSKARPAVRKASRRDLPGNRVVRPGGDV